MEIVHDPQGCVYFNDVLYTAMKHAFATNIAEEERSVYYLKKLEKEMAAKLHYKR